MVTRRDFLKYTTGAVALSMVGGSAKGITSLQGALPSGDLCQEDRREIPLLAEVDLVVVGGSARGVEAAVAAAKEGAKVFLAAELPYLGDEICGTLAQYEGLNDTPKNICHHFLYGLEGTLKTTIAVKLLGEGKEPTTPLYMKRLLEDELLDSGVEFLYSSMVTNIIIDRRDRASGVVIANRSGRYAIRAKEIIDATHSASVVRAAGASLLPDGRGSVDFSMRTVGGHNLKARGGCTAVELSLKAKDINGSYSVTRHTISKRVDTLNYATLSEIEQELRDYSFSPDQLDSSDLLDYLPPFTISGKISQRGEVKDSRAIPTEAMQPRDLDGVTVLGPCLDLSLSAREALTIPEMMLLGEITGVRIARKALKESYSGGDRLLTDRRAADSFGSVSEPLSPLRPKYQSLGTIESPKGALPILGRYDVVVMGGGTAGAPAAISSANHGAKTLLLEYLHGLGGTGTFGMIGRYWDGFKEGFTDKVGVGVRGMAPLDHPRQMKNWKNEWPFNWKVEWYRQQVRQNGGEIWFGVMGSGALVKDGKVKGVVVTTPFSRGVVLCDIVIDSTGSADIAIAAGSAYNFIEHQSPAVQGAGLPKVDLGDHYNNTDWTFADDSDILDVTRLFVQGKRKFTGSYDIGKLPQTRERRRIVGEHEVSTYDVINHRRYSDTISFHQSSFDTHGITINPLFTLVAPEREHVIYNADVPLRSLLPQGLDGIIVTGLGASADRDAMPVIRMQPCLQNQGYSVGYLAATCIKERCSVREVDIKKIQKYLVEIGNLPERVLTDKDFKEFSNKELSRAAETIQESYKGLERLITQPDMAIKLSNRHIEKGASQASLLAYASIASILGDGTHADILARHIASNEWDGGWHYSGMGQFGECMGRMDSSIMALGNSKRGDLIEPIIEKAKELTPYSYYSNFRAICEAFEAMGESLAADTLYRLLRGEGMQHHSLESLQSARGAVILNHIDVLNRNKALKELTLARALYYCGDRESLGQKTLERYANGLERIYARYASESLK